MREQKMDKFAFWLSTTNTMMVEVAHDQGFTKLVFDMEHGVFDQSEMNMFVPFCKALGFEVYAKVLGPEAVPIQQALDFGVDGVIIPHIEGASHAAVVSGFAKYPPLGTRSFAAGRIIGYGGIPEDFYTASNATIKCFPMIESAAALDDIADIIALPTVDGVFVGPTDLALSRGRSGYVFNTEDQADIQSIADAANKYGKPWVMPAWGCAERAFSTANNVDWMVVLDEHGVAVSGLVSGLTAIKAE